MRIRHQLAAYSPVTVGSIAGAAGALAGRSDSLVRLRALLRQEFVADDVILVDSGTHALQLAIAIAAKSVGGRPTVALPAFQCFDVATAALGADLPVALYDIEPRTLAPDATSLERALERGARVVVVAPLYGMPVDWEALEGMANRHGAMLIEDAAQGNGSSWKGRPLGAVGRISTLSFSRGKGWTGGSGGAVLLRGGMTFGAEPMTNAPAAAEVRNLIGLAAQWTLGRPSLYGIPRAIPALGLGETRFHEPTPIGAMARSAASALLSNRRATLAETELRRSNAAELRARLSSDPDCLVDMPPTSECGYLRLPVRIRGGIKSLDEAAARHLGLAASYPISLADLPQLSRALGSPAEGFVGARELAQELITAPTHSRLTAADRDAIVGLVAARKGKAPFRAV